MSETAESLSLAEEAARLDAKASLQYDRRVPKTGSNQLQGVHDVRTCRHQDRIFVTVRWSSEAAKNAAAVSSSMGNNQEAIKKDEGTQKTDADWSVFDRLIH